MKEVSKSKSHVEETEETPKSSYLKVEETTVKNTKWKKSVKDKSVEFVKTDLGSKIPMTDNSTVSKHAPVKTNTLPTTEAVKNVSTDLCTILVTEK